MSILRILQWAIRCGSCSERCIQSHLTLAVSRSSQNPCIFRISPIQCLKSCVSAVSRCCDPLWILPYLAILPQIRSNAVESRLRSAVRCVAGRYRVSFEVWLSLGLDCHTAEIRRSDRMREMRRDSIEDADESALIWLSLGLRHSYLSRILRTVVGERLWLRLPLSPILASLGCLRSFDHYSITSSHILSQYIIYLYILSLPSQRISSSLTAYHFISGDLSISPLLLCLSAYLTLSHFTFSFIRIVAPCLSLSFQCLLRASFSIRLSHFFPSSSHLQYLAVSQRCVSRCACSHSHLSISAVAACKIACHSRVVSLSKSHCLRAISHFFWVSSSIASSNHLANLAVSA